MNAVLKEIKDNSRFMNNSELVGKPQNNLQINE